MLFLKNVKDKALNFLLVLKIWAIIFHVFKFEVTESTLLKIMGRRTCYFVLLIHTYVTLIQCRRKPFVPIHLKIAALSIFSKIFQKCILFGRYCLTLKTLGIYFY